MSGGVHRAVWSCGMLFSTNTSHLVFRAVDKRKLIEGSLYSKRDIAEGSSLGRQLSLLASNFWSVANTAVLFLFLFLVCIWVCYGWKIIL